MATTRIAYANLLTVSGVTISSSSEATGYVDDNLANPARWRKWRSTTTTGDQWVKFDLGANTNFQVLAAINAVIHSGGNLKAQANATDSWGAPTVNDTLAIPSPDYTGVAADWISSVQNLRWIRFYFTNTSAVNAYVELAGVFAGVYTQPTIALAPGFSVVRKDPSIQRYAIGGQRSTAVRAKYHEASGAFAAQSASARDSLRTVFETNGAAIPCLFAADSSTASLIFYGAIQELPFSHRPLTADRWDVPFRFVEDVP